MPLIFLETPISTFNVEIITSSGVRKWYLVFGRTNRLEISNHSHMPSDEQMCIFTLSRERERERGAESERGGLSVMMEWSFFMNIYATFYDPSLISSSSWTVRNSTAKPFSFRWANIFFLVWKNHPFRCSPLNNLFLPIVINRLHYSAARTLPYYFIT